MIKNIRIAEGAVPLYDRLKTDGKLVFDNILFDYNQATLKKESLPVISDIAKLMKEATRLRRCSMKSLVVIGIIMRSIS